MPLSEHEQRLLEQMERALYAEDPKFASALRGADPRTHYRRRAVKASLGFLAGVVLLLTGVLTEPFVSVAGFLVMLASAFFALSSWRSIPNAADLGVGGGGAQRRSPKPGGRSGGATAMPSAGGGKTSKPRRKGSFMQRLEERWNRRREQGGR